MPSQVTLRDLSTNEEFSVPPEGYIFGRVGGDADVQIEDNAISRRQARVSFKNGQWLLEVLAVPAGQKAPRAQALGEGSTFNVGQGEYEVVQVEIEEEEMDPSAKTVAPPSRGKPPPPAAAPAPAKKAPAAPMNAKTAPAAPAQKRTATASQAEAPADDAGGDEIPAKGFGALFVAAPKGLAYYLLNVPKLLVNPIGTTRSAIEEQPAEPMGRIELIGYALPSLIIAGCLGSFAAGIALLIGPGHVFSLMSFIPIVPIISGFIGAIVTGYIFHPVLTWIIDKLKGHSDARSRTNYFLAMQTVALVVAVPNALGVIFASLPIPFINLLGPLLMVVGSLASLYVVHQWMAHFEVMKWVLLVIKILAVLSLLGTGFGFVSGLIATIRGLGSSSSSVAVDVPSGDGDDTAAAATALEEMPKDPEEAKAWAKKRTEQAQKAAAEAQKKALAAAKEATEKANAEAKENTPPEPKEEPVKPTKETTKETTKVAEVKETPPAPVNEPEVRDTAAPSGGYGAFAHKRDGVEKLFENDPTVLANNPELQKLYGKYLEASYELDKKYQKDNLKNPERAKLNARLHDAELFKATSGTINTLAEKLKVR